MTAAIVGKTPARSIGCAAKHDRRFRAAPGKATGYFCAFVLPFWKTFVRPLLRSSA